MVREPPDEAAQLAAIVASSDDAILTTDLDGIVTSWNPAAERMYGYTAAEAIGQPNHFIIPPDRYAEEGTIIRRVLAGEPVAHYESVRIRRDGSRVDVSTTVSPIRARDGRIVGFSEIARDISARRRTEHYKDEPLAAVRRLAAIVESADDAIIGLDLAGTITAWNSAAERMYGYTAAEALGRSIHMTLPEERLHEETTILEQVARGEKIDHFETIRCRKDGRRVPVSLTVSPIRDETGAVVGASKIARDITERKHAAQRAAFLAEAGTVLAGSLDYERTLKTIANLAVPTIADWCAVDVRTEEGKLERLAVAHVDPAKIEVAKKIRAVWEDPHEPYSPAYVVRTGTPTILAEITDGMVVALARGDQEQLRLLRSLGLRSYIIVPLVAHGRTLGALTLATAESRRRYTEDDFRFAQDIAFRAALAVDNARAYAEAQAANHLKDEFLATLSHELRTPLNAIIGYARLLRSGVMIGHQHARALETVDRNATSLAQMVDDILDVSRIISGKIRLSVQPVDLPQVVRNAVETMELAAKAKEINLRAIVDPDAAPVSGDPDRLQQIVWNLISNAVKFTPKRGTVQVRLARVDSHVEVVVSDTGVGITPEFLPHIFERFRQADSATTREHGGLGLGLAIVRHLVELHGGTIDAASGGRGQGATFRVRLPLMGVQPEPQASRPGVPRADDGNRDGALPDLRRVHVLVVEDDADSRAIVQETLEAAGARVTTAGSAAEALAALKQLRPDVLLADIGMPGEDGYGLIARIRGLSDAALRDIPAAALTAYARPEDRVRALQSGFEMHLGKPVDLGELVASVAALAKRARGSGP